MYLVRCGAKGEDEDYALQNGITILGYTEVPSLEKVVDRDEVHTIVRQTYPDSNEHRSRHFSRQLWCFMSTIQVGDLIILPRKRTSQIAIGRVKGPYEYERVRESLRHTRQIEWLETELPRTVFRQDLLYSFGAYMTVCNVSRNDAVRRVHAVLEAGNDPGISTHSSSDYSIDPDDEIGPDELPDLQQLAHDQIVAEIQTRFAGHGLTRLVDAVLQVDGWTTSVSPSGPDGGVDILAGRGPLGLNQPRLCVQVKSQISAADVLTYRALQGTMQSFNAEQGLLICWGGFKKSVILEAKQRHFSVRLWNSVDLVTALFRTYESLPEEIQAELPLKRTWMLVKEEPTV